MLVFRIDGDHAVRDDIQVLIEYERDRVADLHVLGRTGLDIDQRAGVIRRLHAAGQDAHRPQTDQPHAHQKQRQNDHQHYQHGGDGIAHFLNLFWHLRSSFPFAGIPPVDPGRRADLRSAACPSRGRARPPARERLGVSRHTSAVTLTNQKDTTFYCTPIGVLYTNFQRCFCKKQTAFSIAVQKAVQLSSTHCTFRPRMRQVRGADAQESYLFLKTVTVLLVFREKT